MELNKRQKKSDTKIGTIEKKYGVDLGAKSDMKLGNYLKREGLPSMSKALKSVEKLLKSQKDLPIGIDEWIKQGIKYGYSNYQNLAKDKEFLFKIGMLRQWLNEDRISDPSKMVSNEDLLKWFK